MKRRVVLFLALLLTSVDTIVRAADGVTGSPPGCC